MTDHKRRLSVGTLIRNGERILLVRHVKPSIYDFWVAPGGGVEAGEDIVVAARREAREEAGVDVEIGPLGYIEQLYGPITNTHQTKLWFHARYLSGALSTEPASVEREGITQVTWIARDDLTTRNVFPLFLRGADFWQFDWANARAPQVLPIQTMAYE